MTEESKAVSTPAAEPARGARPPRRRWWVTAVLVAVIFAGGFVCGAGTTVVAVALRVRESVQHPERTPDRIARWLKGRLRLTAGQAEQVGAIIKSHHANLLAIRREVAPRVRAELDAIREEVAGVLDERQRAQWRKLMGNFEKNWIPAAPPAKGGEEWK